MIKTGVIILFAMAFLGYFVTSWIRLDLESKGKTKWAKTVSLLWYMDIILLTAMMFLLVLYFTID